MNRNIIIAAIIIILVLVGFWLWSRQAAAPDQSKIAPTGDTTSTINSDLQNIDIGDLDQEFKGIDTDLQSL